VKRIGQASIASSGPKKGVTPAVCFRRDGSGVFESEDTDANLALPNSFRFNCFCSLAFLVVKRTNVYIYGMNLFYGALKGTPYKWLDVRALGELLIPPGHEVNDVYIFTAYVIDRPDNPNQAKRQALYLSALESGADVHVVLGQFRTQIKRLRTVDEKATTVLASVSEEKGSDVNLAVQLVCDAYDGECDAALVVSNDSDLQAAVDVAERCGVEVTVANPNVHRPRRQSLFAKTIRNVRVSHLVRAQLPHSIALPNGRAAHKPRGWGPPQKR